MTTNDDQKPSISGAARSAGRGVWWIVKLVLGFCVAVYIASLYQANTWFSMTYSKGQFHPGTGGFVSNMFNSFLNGFTSIFSGQIAFGLTHIIVPLFLVVIFAMIAQSMETKSN